MSERQVKRIRRAARAFYELHGKTIDAFNVARSLALKTTALITAPGLPGKTRGKIMHTLAMGGFRAVFS